MNLNQRINHPTAYSLQPIASIRPASRIVTRLRSWIIWFRSFLQD
ncbi:MAG TPA: hypothetical protein VJK54_04040 [Chthoniobacterales bacterium]|nr:hypothetical protein [Chthoniobacterales bacterium]